MRKFLLILFVLFVAGCADVPAGNYVIMPVTGTLTGTYQSYCQGNVCWNAQLVTQTPTSTPKSTKTPKPTSTPTSSGTPTPVETVIPPTQENTPQPTIPATGVPPDESKCWVGIRAVSLNVRSEPTIPSTHVYGQLHNPDRARVYEILVMTPEGSDKREEWGLIQFGDFMAYIALWYNGEELAVADDAIPCWEISHYPQQLCLGWHATQINVNYNDMIQSFQIWKDKGQCVSAKSTEDHHAAAIAIAYGGIGAVRYKRGGVETGDCSSIKLDPVVAANQFWNNTKTAALTLSPPDQGYWLELDNECQGIYFQNLEWLDTYFSTEIELVSPYYGSHMIFGTMASGQWTEERIKGLPKTWEIALERGVCFGMHSGQPLAGHVSIEGLTTTWLWPYTYQQRNIKKWLSEMNPRYVTIPFCMTEYANGAWSKFSPQDYVDYTHTIVYDGVITINDFTAGDWNYDFGVNGRMKETALLW